MAALRPAARLLLVAALALLPLAVSLARGRAQAELRFDARTAPEHFAHYRMAADTPLEPEVLEMLRPQSYVMRLYRSEEAQDAWIYLAGYSATDTTGAHDPTVCYPSQGWDLQAVRTVSVALESGESFTARLLLANQAGQQELVLYWFQPMGRWTRGSPWEQLLRAYDGFAGRSQYVFVRISTEFTDLAEPTLLELARHLAPWVRSAMAPPVAALGPPPSLAFTSCGGLEGRHLRSAAPRCALRPRLRAACACGVQSLGRGALDVSSTALWQARG